MSTSGENTAGLVQRLSPKLTGKGRRHLRSLGHELKPIVMVGHKGVTDNLIENLEAALLTHELVKVKVHEGEEIETIAEALHTATGASLAQKIGHILLFYRAHPENPQIKIP